MSEHIPMTLTITAEATVTKAPTTDTVDDTESETDQ